MILVNDFKKEYQYYKKHVSAAIEQTLESGWYVLGTQVKSFEEEFAAYMGTKYAIGVANGLEALQISLLALNIGEGDEVITVSNSAVATALAITNTGATPVFVDTDEYYHMDAAAVEKAITQKTKAILPVHLFGQAADMDTLIKIAEKHNLHIVEDACQAAGASYNGKKAGSFGTLGCFSFYPTKNLGAYGDGGAIVTDSQKLYEACKKLRNYGQEDRYHHTVKGLNSRLDELQAAVLRVKLPYLNEANTKRKQIAKLYRDELASIPQIKLPKQRANADHVYHLFVIETEQRDALMQFLKEQDIQSLIHYPLPIHQQQCYEEYNNVVLPKTEHDAQTILSLPIHPFVTADEVQQVCTAIKAFYNRV